MMKVIRSEERHTGDFGWLKTHWHFSFGDYYDPKNENFGPLRVFNDDVVAAGQGFGMHPHKDMEIVTYVIDGELEHSDSLGHKGVIHAEEVQVMVAGSGIRHGERNPSAEKAVHFIQLWILPRTLGRKPGYEQRSFAGKVVEGRLVAVVSGGDLAGTMVIDQDAGIYLGKFEKGDSVVHAMGEGRKGYLFVIDGEVEVNGKKLGGGDQARMEGEKEVAILARGRAHLMLLDMVGT